ncbi:hypothetical protein DYB32_000804 [Aphanomyces invadans]|uniref:Dynein regulatory complex subunit 7 n=1 Tax=Aphanomyces invadans TaxID=157072 RepID=A0A418B8U3_9STRA|nr:hypothetical protein DYB32_000804 [Aphanomyces invadans]
MPSENNDDIDFSERQPLYEGKPQSRQCTVAGIVSTKQRRLEDNVMEEVPMSYSTNSNKELLCLEYVANFRKQFDDLMDASDIRRPPLYLCPPNERGIPKFVCTTLRPTLLPFLDLYDMDKLATFVSGLIEYEPLVDPCAPPACLPSPSAVLAWQAGDSFDMANLLASFLIGAGYDAYVVHGYDCLDAVSQTECPYLAETAPTASGTTTTPPAATDATAAPKDEGKSKFVAMQEAKEAARRAEEAARLDWTKHMDVEDDDEDELNGKRVHAWVLVLLLLCPSPVHAMTIKLVVTEHVYLEPSTGRKYSVRESPYVRIEAVWNHQNYWVNMQVSRGKDASATCADTLFDLSHATDWEFVFLSAHDRRGATNGGGGLHGDGGGGESKHDDLDGSRSDNNSHHHHHTHDSHDDNDPDNAADDNVLDLPPSWVTKLHVERKAYKRRFVTDGQRTTLFRKAKVEEFAENSHNQGLVLRITQFRNVARTLPVQVREVNAWRDDFLVGRSVALSEDKEEVKNGAATFVLPGGATGELTVLKMAEKFDRNERKNADEEGKITSGARIYHKAPGTPVEVPQVDPMATRPKESILERELQASIQVMPTRVSTVSRLDRVLDRCMEKECYNSIRHADVETQEILKFRRREEATIVLETSIFDSHDDETKQDRVDDQRKAGKDAKADMDYLSPFLLSVAGHGGGGASAGRQLSRDEAHSVRDLCLKNLKERLLERANIIQTRLDKENAALAKKQAAFQRSQREHDQGTDEEFERFCSETMFRIQILEQRLTRHEETALQKYAELDQRLHNDARLAVLHQ